MTTVRYFPRSGLVMVRDPAAVITFRVAEINEINPRLAEFGFYAVRDWRQDNGQRQGTTRHAGDRAAA